MEKEFVPYKQSLELKELGFDEPCFGFWLSNKTIQVGTESGAAMLSAFGNVTYFRASLYQQAFRWFREKHNLFSHVGRCLGMRDECYFVEINTITEMLGIYDSEEDQVIFRSHSEAEIACLNKLIEIVKQKKNKK